MNGGPSIGWRKEHAVAAVALAVAMFTLSACGAAWSASGWRDGVTRGLLVALAAVLALRSTHPGLVYFLVAIAAVFVRTFLVAPLVDGTLMPTLLGPRVSVNEAMTLAWDHSRMHLWWSALDFAMIVPGAAFVAAFRRVDSVASAQLLAGGWLVVVTAIDAWLFYFSEHGGKQLVLCAVITVYLFALARRERAAASEHVPLGTIALTSLALVVSIAIASWLRYEHPCDRPGDSDALRRWCAFSL